MVVRHLGRDLKVAPLISHTPSLEEAPAMFADMLERRTWCNKVVFAAADEAQAELIRPGGVGGVS
ncbi:hypothetical protein [Streptomyces hygroscopicus]|uniref:hypothetical protein n=1 Tax=Streptomyces hygroscopicus TaxID=1912 RepID=UPI0033FA333D